MGEMRLGARNQPVFAAAGLWQRTAAGHGFTAVTCDPTKLIGPAHPRAMITIPRPEDLTTWLQGCYAAIVSLQRSFGAGRMTLRAPVFRARWAERLRRK
ncbi:hypothetical protein EDF57_109125 [Novosphingobium sp. PhB55]|uniref:hypothetical protein n=1 Tax=Novosphingobium sp. PhB55 TaxID=2485106 RepID=UPI0010E1D7FE|nr:hypothetical protein EDF57_109125 [Novosphingobium sp. PhB55]